MKKFLTVFLQGLMFTLFAGVLTPTGESLPCNAVTILIPKEPTLTESYAGALLKEYLEKITSRKFNLTKEGEAFEQPFISLGQTSQYSQAELPANQLGEDGYAIEVKDGNWFITGGRRSGPVTGVLALLEEDLGCRWFAPWGKPFIPKHEVLNICPRSFVSPLIIRDPFYQIALSAPEWSGMNRTSPYAWGTLPDKFGGSFRYSKKYFVHTFNTLFPVSEFGKSNPEFFPLIRGKRVISAEVQRCLSQPAMVDIAVEKFIQEIKRDPNAMVYSISPNDYKEGHCKCQKCSMLEKQEGSYSGPVLAFANQVAEKLEKVYPDKRISFLAYNQTLTPPKTIRPHKNITVLFCVTTGDVNSYYYSVDEIKSVSDAYFKWAKLGAKFQIWDYALYFNDYPMPVPNIGITEKNIDTFVKNNAIGIMIQGAHQGKGASLENLRIWVLAKKLWNPNLSMMKLAREFVEGYYGCAAEPMWRYVELQEEYREKQKNTEKIVKYTILPMDFVEKSLKLMDEAKTLAGDNKELLTRILCEEFSVRYLFAKHGAKTDNLAAYRENLDWLKKNSKELKITKFSETGYDRFAEWEMNLASPPYSPNTIRPLPLLWATKYRPTQVKATDTPTGKTVMQPARNADASITYPFSQIIPGMPVGETFLLRIRCKAGWQNGKEPSKRTPVFTCGWSSPGLGEKRTIESDKIKSDYRWIPIALMRNINKPSAWNGKIYLNTIPNTQLEAVYYDSLEIIPLKEYKEKSQLPRLPVFSLNE